MVTIFIFSILGCILAWWKLKDKNPSYALFLLVFCGLLLRIYTSLDPYLNAWDERYHALVAKHLMNHFLLPTLYENPILPYNIQNWAGNYIWLHKQPIPLWLIAISLKFFGVNTFAVRIPSILMSTIGIKLIYDIGKYMYGVRVAFIAAFLFSIHGLIIDLNSGRTATDHIDIAFLFFILLSVWCVIKYAQGGLSVYTVLTGIFLGLAILSKWMPALIVLPIWFCISKIAKRNGNMTLLFNFIIISFVTALVVLPWQYYILNQFPIEAKWEYGFNVKHILVPLEGHDGNWFYHFDNLRIIYGELIYIPIIWFTYRAFKNIRDYKNQILLIWFWVPFIFFSFVATKMQAYTVFAAPAIFIITAVSFESFKKLAYKIHKFKWLLIAISYGLLILPIRYAIERIKPFHRPQQPVELVNEINTIKRIGASDKTVFFNCHYPIEDMFYTNVIAYEMSMPDSTAIKIISAKGYSYQILK